MGTSKEWKKTEEFKKLRSKHGKEWYALPENKERTAKRNAEWYALPENKKLRSKHGKEWYALPENKERTAKRNAAASRDGRAAVRGAKKRAKKLGLPFDIDHAYMMTLWPDDGVDFFGLEMKWKGACDGKSGVRPESPTIDRIDPAKGYVRGNVMWLSNKYNNLKGGLSLADMDRLCRAFLHPQMEEPNDPISQQPSGNDAPDQFSDECVTRATISALSAPVQQVCHFLNDPIQTIEP